MITKKRMITLLMVVSSLFVNKPVLASDRDTFEKIQLTEEQQVIMDMVRYKPTIYNIILNSYPQTLHVNFERLTPEGVWEEDEILSQKVEGKDTLMSFDLTYSPQIIFRPNASLEDHSIYNLYSKFYPTEVDSPDKMEFVLKGQFYDKVEFEKDKAVLGIFYLTKGGALNTMNEFVYEYNYYDVEPQIFEYVEEVYAITIELADIVTY